MVDAKCNSGVLTSWICCLCCMYMIFKPAWDTRKFFKSKGVPIPFNVTLMLCCLSCCMSVGVFNLADCGLQYAGLKQKFEEAVFGKEEE